MAWCLVKHRKSFSVVVKLNTVFDKGLSHTIFLESDCYQINITENVLVYALQCKTMMETYYATGLGLNKKTQTTHFL
jgi:hypothetical protein